MGVARDKLAATVAVGSTLLIDTCVLIAYLEGEQNITDAATLLIDDWLYHGRNKGFISMMSAMELLVGPFKANRPTTDCLDFLQRFPNLTCIPIDMSVAQQSAIVRARHNIRPPDALIVGTAIAIGADAIVTNDNAWSKTMPTRIVLLNDYIQ